MSKVKIKPTVGAAVAKNMLPCVDVQGNITVCIPYMHPYGKVVISSDSIGARYGKAEAWLKSARAKLEKYIDRRIAKAFADM